MVKGVSAEKEKTAKPWDHVKEETYFYRESKRDGDSGRTRTNDNNRISAIFQNPITGPVVPIVWRPSKEKEITAKPNAVRKETEASSSKLTSNRKETSVRSFDPKEFQPKYASNDPFQAKQLEFYGATCDNYTKMFDKLKREDKQHLYGDSAQQRKLKFFHGHLSSHQVEKPKPRAESALLPTNSHIFDQEYQNSVPALSTEACKERVLLSKLDLCVDKAHLLKRRAHLDDDCLFKDDTTKANPYDSDIFHQQIPNQPKIHTMKRNQTEKSIKAEFESKKEKSIVNAREPFKNSAESTMKEYGKGMPTDPTYYTKLSVKSIKDALLKSKPVNEVIEQVADPSLRKYQRRGSQDVTVAPTTDTHEVVEYKLSNVASTIDGIAIKKELTNKGVHVMRSEVGEDKLTQIRTGQGTLLVREEKNKAGNSEPATKLNKLGIGATNEAKCFTNRYFNDTFCSSWHSRRTEGMDRELEYKYSKCNPKEKRVLEMSSKGQLFGSLYN